MDIQVRVWRQQGPSSAGKMVTYDVKDISPDASFLEMLDVLNEKLILDGDDPVAFDHDCREGICGMCGMMINGVAHGPERATTTCQLHMRHFADGDTIDIEPWRAKAFPVIKDLVTDRSAFDEIIKAGGYISVNTGSAPEAHAIPVDKVSADDASVPVLRAAGLDPAGGGSFFLPFLGAARATCEQDITANTVPYGARLDDDHHGTCHRVLHIQQLARLGAPSSSAPTAPRRRTANGS